MATHPEAGPRQRVRRRRRVLIAVTLVAALLGGCAWWFVLKPALDQRRPFVGTWRLESPVFPARPEPVVEIDLMLDGTMRDRVWNPDTGAVDYEQLRPGRWRIANGRFQEVLSENPLLRLAGAGRQTRLGWDHPVTWEGPDRFRLDGTSPGRRTMVWSRCDRTGGR